MCAEEMDRERKREGEGQEKNERVRTFHSRELFRRVDVERRREDALAVVHVRPVGWDGMGEGRGSGQRGEAAT